jgi:hypothetical protein
LKNVQKSSDDERRVEAQKTKVERNQMTNLHHHFAVMKGVKILASDWILTQEDAMLFITRMQFFDALFLHKLFIDLLYFKGLASFIIDHKIERRDLIGD